MMNFNRWIYFVVHGCLPRRRWKKPRRGPARSWRYRAWIRTFPCLICERWPAHAAHTGTDGGMRMKASDFSCVPLCREHHLEFDSGRLLFELKYEITMVEEVRTFNEQWRSEWKAA